MLTGWTRRPNVGSPRRAELDQAGSESEAVGELCRVLDVFAGAHRERVVVLEAHKAKLAELSVFDLLLYASLYAFAADPGQTTCGFRTRAGAAARLVGGSAHPSRLTGSTSALGPNDFDRIWRWPRRTNPTRERCWWLWNASTKRCPTKRWPVAQRNDVANPVPKLGPVVAGQSAAIAGADNRTSWPLVQLLSGLMLHYSIVLR